MSNILIADAGSTKTDWSLISVTKNDISRFKSLGINPVQQSSEQIFHVIDSFHHQLHDIKIDKIYFFGAGCLDSLYKKKIRDILQELFNPCYITVESDVIGAAKALFGKDAGLVALLGTGSNTALCADEKIQYQIPSLGYILGDEGSGSAMGKTLINKIFKQQLSDSITIKFQDAFHLDINEVINHVYRQPSPAAYLASFVPFLKENIHNTEIRNLVENELDNFFIKNILPYKISPDMPMGFVGSIAFIFKDILTLLAQKHQLTITKIIKAPMPELEKFYSKIN